VKGLWGFDRVSRRCPFWLAQTLVLLVTLLSGSAFASVPAGLCAPTAQSLEAPPPIYPQDESFADGCPQDESQLEFGAPARDDRPTPELQKSFEIVKCPPQAVEPFVAQALCVDAARESLLIRKGRDAQTELLRPPQVAERR
jgi:hypothetical protein